MSLPSTTTAFSSTFSPKPHEPWVDVEVEAADVEEIEDFNNIVVPNSPEFVDLTDVDDQSLPSSNASAEFVDEVDEEFQGSTLK